MSQEITVAAIQMDANPAPTNERIARAEKLVRQAASDGAQLIILPELFNTSYAYADTNFGLAERFDGQTTAWLREAAIAHPASPTPPTISPTGMASA